VSISHGWSGTLPRGVGCVEGGGRGWEGAMVRGAGGEGGELTPRLPPVSTLGRQAMSKEVSESSVGVTHSIRG
jgi:hypothetical protein